MGILGGSVIKNPPAKQDTQDSWAQSLCWEDSLGGGNGNLLVLYSYLGKMHKHYKAIEKYHQLIIF